MGCPIPKRSAEAWRIQKDRAPHNPGLVFDRFISDWGFDKDRDAKRKAWQEILGPVNKPDQELFKEWRNLWEATVRAAGAAPFSLKTQWRLVAGLGRKGLLEVGFTFNQYGFPVVPGSSLKGLARMWVLVVLAEALGISQLKELDSILTVQEEKEYQEAFLNRYPAAGQNVLGLAGKFRSVFGTIAGAGGAVFFDAIPARMPKLELDVMNPHYSEYYQDKSRKIPPANWLSPVPVYFLTVAPGTEFIFAVGWRGSHDEETSLLWGLAREWLVQGLQNLGVGAKTSAGYGYFVRPG
ncbi:MAG: type III-B CRISPR module RAMP protein Cmr6 [Bacillota bacterium]